MAWQISSDTVSFHRPLDTGPIFTFAASEVAKERTGVHARVTISQDNAILAFSRFNVDDDAKRTTLSNRAYEKLGAAEREGWPARFFKHEFDLFCFSLWEHWLSRLSAEEMAGDPDIGPLGFILTPYVLDEGGVIPFGPPGAGKSWLLYLMAQSIHHGADTLWPCVQRRVLVVNLERPERSVRRRLASINAILGLEPTASLPVLNIRGMSFADAEPVVRREMERHRAEVLLTDSLSRTGFGKLVSDDVANMAMDSFNRLAQSWFLVAHPPRDGGHVFGSIMFDAAADLTLRVWSHVKRDGSTMGVAIKGDKANDCPKPPLRIYHLRFDQYGLAEFRLAERGEFPTLEREDPQSLADQLAAFLAQSGPMSATELEPELNVKRARISEALSGDPRFQVARRDGKRVLYEYRPDTKPTGTDT